MPKQNKHWWILFSTGIMLVLVNLDMTIVNLALPKIANAFKANINQAQWVITSYLLATIITFSIFGRLADLIGRKKVFLIGVSFFTLGSLGAGLSPTMLVLLFSRFVQGLGFAATLGLAFVIIHASFPESKRNIASGLAIGIVGVSQALGPTVGGLIVQYANWHWVFLINVPLGILSLCMVWHVVTNELLQNNKQTINLSNVSLFILGMTALFYLVNQWVLLNSIAITIVFTIIIVAFVAFYYMSHQVANPLINLTLLKHKNFFILSMIRCLFMMLFNSYLFIAPLYLQNVYGFSAEHAGLTLLMMTGMVAIMSPITGRMLDYISFMRPIFISLLLACLAIAFLFFIQAQGHLVLFYIGLMLLGLAVGLHIPASITAVNQMSPKEEAGSAMGVFFTFAITGAMIGVALAGNCFASESLAFLTAHMPAQHLHGSLLRAASGVENIHHLPVAWQSLAAAAFMYAYHRFMLLILLTTVMALLMQIYLSRSMKKLA